MKEKILVVNVAASSGGALTILNQYYNKAINDQKNDYVFVISTPILKSTKNVKVLRYPWVKKSWLHRLYFDNIIVKKVVEKESPTKILSLQNTYIKNKKQIEQTIYVHQSLPFTPIKMSLIRDFKMWIYQNIIGRIIKKSIKKADKIIVQTLWMKEAVINKTGISEKNIYIEQPKLNLPSGYKYTKNKDNLFFYPAIATKYKNHRVIVEASKLLKKENINNYTIEFTLTGNENKHIKKLKKECKKNKLPIKFIGKLSYEEVIKKYSKSTLLFPSYVETFGLPLLEAKTIGSPIIASDTPFAREITTDYDDISYFKYDNAIELFEEIFKKISEIN